ncbi:mitochondrial genome maintenance MGM101-domain-containing protein [Kalaharituber pfeilii]|nr:mitochondrial genome maintenance MGM101-domain-containing protein [Kalaharituber pfeilii]
MSSLLAKRCPRQLLPIAKPLSHPSHPLAAVLPYRSFTANAAAAPAAPPSTATSTAPKPAAAPPRAAYAPPSTTSPPIGAPTPAKATYAPSSTTSSSVGAPPAATAFRSGLNDTPAEHVGAKEGIDWARSFSGLSREPFPREVIDILLAPLNLSEIEIKPDGIIYLPEIKYRRILNLAFGPGGWGLAPRSDTIVTSSSVTREYGLVCHGRLVSVARGEQDYFDPSGIPTATEGCKSNALMRCCKDLGIASELWDPRFIRKFKKEMCQEVMVEHVPSKKKRKIWVRKGDNIEYPYHKV